MAKKQTKKTSAAKKQETKNVPDQIDAQLVIQSVQIAAESVGHAMNEIARHETVAKSLLKNIQTMNGKLVKMAESIEDKVGAVNRRILRDSSKESRKAEILEKKKAQLAKLKAQVEKLES